MTGVNQRRVLLTQYEYFKVGEVLKTQSRDTENNPEGFLERKEGEGGNKGQLR